MKMPRQHAVTQLGVSLAGLRSIETADAEHRRQFFSQLSDGGEYMFHGSQSGQIDVLSTERKSSDISEFGKAKQVFATPDLFWAMWFALLDRSRLKCTMNGCYIRRHRGGIESVYDFAIDEESYKINPAPLRPGRIYVLPRAPFTEANHEITFEGIPLAEYGSRTPVTPLCSFEVLASDFPYIHLIEGRAWPPNKPDAGDGK